MCYQSLIQNSCTWFCSIDKNAFYYLLSTIPQVTAAVFALSSAFILRKYDLFDKEVNNLSKFAALVNPISLIPFSSNAIEEIKEKKNKLKKLFTLVAILFCLSSLISLFGIVFISEKNCVLNFIICLMSSVTLSFYIVKQWKLIKNTFLKYEL